MKPVLHSDRRAALRDRDTSAVVVICASEAMRVAVEISLSLVGYRVTTASSAEEGLRAIATAQPDLVIVQAEWPNEDTKGETTVALLHAVRAGRRLLPFLILVQAGYEVPDELLGSMVEHMCLPWDEERLRRTVAYLIDRRRCGRHQSAEPTESEIEQALLQARGVLSKAARHLGMTAEALYERMRKLHS